MNHKLSRRSFLTSTTAIALSQLMLGCGNTSGTPEIFLLEDSIPTQLIGDFRKTLAKVRQKKQFVTR
jgi:putative spermidine/putrescine transport system substrate-binding protein